MRRNSACRTLGAAAVLLILASLTACKPDNIFFSVQNGSGGKLHDVKVTYPDDKLTFGTLDDSTITGTYRHFDGPGDLGVSFSTEDGQSHSSSGPRVTGNEKGEVKINIGGSYASFDTNFEQSQQ
jgi:hypothetical protein